MDAVENKLKSMLYEAKVKTKTYGPSLFFMSFTSPIYNFISTQIAYNEQEAQDLAINEWIKRTKENTSLDQKKKDARLRMFEDREFKLSMWDSIALPDMLVKMQDYFKIPNKKESVIEKLKK